MKFTRAVAIGVAIYLLAVMPQIASAQVLGNLNTISLSMTVAESLTETCTPSAISFTYSSASGGTATASGPITCVRTWNFAASRTDLDLASWLSSSTAALSNGTVNIPSSQVLDSLDGGAPSACTGSDAGTQPLDGIALDGAICENVGMTINSGNRTGGDSHTHLLSMAGLGSLPAGVFTGVYNVESSSN